jgi:hypothetical protein
MPNSAQPDETQPQCMLRLRGVVRRVGFRSELHRLGWRFLRWERLAPRVVLARATQETRAFAADCNSLRFDRLVANVSSSFDFFAREVCLRADARLKV